MFLVENIAIPAKPKLVRCVNKIRYEPCTFDKTNMYYDIDKFLETCMQKTYKSTKNKISSKQDKQ